MKAIEFADVDDKLLVVTTDKGNVLKFRVLYLCCKSVIVRVEVLGDIGKWQGEEGALFAANLPDVAPEKGLLAVMMRDVEPRIAPGYIGCLNLSGRAEVFFKVAAVKVEV